MSEWHVETVKIGPITKHPDADNLSITLVHGGYPCIIKTGDFREGDLATYIPIDSVVPDVPMFSFLKNRRIKPLKLRGIFSMGLLMPPVDGSAEGDDLAEALGIRRWEPADAKENLGGEAEKAPTNFKFVEYTDLHSLRRGHGDLRVGEEVVLTEKIHGTNARFVHDGERLWIGSRSVIRKPTSPNVWTGVVKAYDLDERLSRHPLFVFFGEVYGKGIQDLKYDALNGYDFRVFDILNLKDMTYLNFDDMSVIVENLGLKTAPVLYRGPWTPDLMPLHGEGKSTLGDNVREGFVARPVIERNDYRFNRVVYKYVGEGYMLRKKAEDYR